MSEPVRGRVLNLHAFGALLRLDDGRLTAAPQKDVDAHRTVYERALTSRKVVEFLVESSDGHAFAVLAPQLRDEEFEQQIASYLKMTEEWERPDVPPAHERHFLRKKRRASLFESRHATDR